MTGPAKPDRVAIELEYGITVYPARTEPGRWRAVAVDTRIARSTPSVLAGSQPVLVSGASANAVTVLPPVPGCDVRRPATRSRRMTLGGIEKQSGYGRARRSWPPQ
jgi:hypothetical protein